MCQTAWRQDDKMLSNVHERKKDDVKKKRESDLTGWMPSHKKSKSKTHNYLLISVGSNSNIQPLLRFFYH